MTEPGRRGVVPSDDDPTDADIATRTVPLDLEDGGTVVIAQQNVGPDNMVGGGEWKEATLGRSREDAAAEQARLEQRAPTGEGGIERSHVARDLPGEPEERLLAAPASTGVDLRLDRFLGKVPLALCFAGPLPSPVTAEVIRGFDEHLVDFGRERMQAMVLVRASGFDVRRFADEQDVRVPVLADEDGQWAGYFGATHDETSICTVLVDREGRAVATVPSSAGGVHAEEVLERASLLPDFAGGHGS